VTLLYICWPRAHNFTGLALATRSDIPDERSVVMTQDPREQQRTDAERIPDEGVGKLDEAPLPQTLPETEDDEVEDEETPEEQPVK
jgi:hypothetical protein